MHRGCVLMICEFQEPPSPKMFSRKKYKARRTITSVALQNCGNNRRLAGACRSRRSWPRCGWIPVFSAAGEVPETHQVGQRTANARALQAAAGGCGLIRWVRRTFHFVCCFARSRFRHSDAAGGCLANVPCTHRWRYGRAADDPGRCRSLGGRPIHMVMPCCRSIDRHPQRPHSRSS